MSITFISQSQAIVWLLAAISTLAFYILLVRPRIKHHPEFVRIRGNVLGWLKVRWDMATSAALMALPSIWNLLLDGVVALSLLVEQLTPALAGVDMSFLVVPEWLSTWVRILAISLPIVRRVFFDKAE